MRYRKKQAEQILKKKKTDRLQHGLRNPEKLPPGDFINASL